MILDSKRFDEISADDILSLIDENVIESKRLEYKRQPPASGDSKAIFKFIREVASLANASGGFMIIGIAEVENDDGSKVLELHGLGENDIDGVKLRLDQMILNNIEPRLPGFLCQPIEMGDKKTVLLFYFPDSWISPHMITKDGKQEFYSRNNGGKYPMDAHEIRLTFESSLNMRNQILDFHMGRLQRIKSLPQNEYVKGPGIAAIHIYPLATFSGKQTFTLPLIEDAKSKIPLLGQGFASVIRYDHEGTICSDHEGEYFKTRRFTRVLRRGVVEAIDRYTFNEFYDDHPMVECWRVPILRCEDYIFICVKNALEFYSIIGVDGPFTVIYSLMNVNNHLLDVPPVYLKAAKRKVEQESVILEEVIIQSTRAAIGDALRPLFNQIWNVAGEEKSMSYNENDEFRIREQ